MEPHPRQAGSLDDRLKASGDVGPLQGQPVAVAEDEIPARSEPEFAQPDPLGYLGLPVASQGL